jgi:hypothetical protein
MGFFRVVDHRILEMSNFNKWLIQAQELVFFIFSSPDFGFFALLIEFHYISEIEINLGVLEKKF